MLTTFDETVGRVGASGEAATDISLLIKADRVVIDDLDSVGTQTPAGLSRWAAHLSTDGANAIQAGDAVRAALGLPPS